MGRTIGDINDERDLLTITNSAEAIRNRVRLKYNVGDYIFDKKYKIKEFYPNFVLCEATNKLWSTTFLYWDIDTLNESSYMVNHGRKM